MSQKLTREYSERLGLALKEGPHPMSVRKLAEEMSSRYNHLRGSSYGGIRQYVEGKIESPRRELLDAIADVLGVRPEWLASNSGPMTKLQEHAQQAHQQAKSRTKPCDKIEGSYKNERNNSKCNQNYYWVASSAVPR